MANSRTAVRRPTFWRALMARTSSMHGPGGTIDVERARDDVGLVELGAFELAHDAPVLHDGHAIAAADQFVIVGRIERDGGALGGQLAHQAVQLLLGADVEALRGIIWQ